MSFNAVIDAFATRGDVEKAARSKGFGGLGLRVLGDGAKGVGA